MSKPEVAIVGIGIHPFVELLNERTRARRLRCSSSSKGRQVEWSDVQFAFRKPVAGAADTMVSS